MAEDKKPSGSKPKKEEPAAEEAVIGSAMPVQLVSTVKEVKAALPRAFTGSRAESKRFLREVLIYIALNPKAFPDDRSKKFFLLSYMTDGAGEFWKNDKADLLLAFDPEAEKVTWSEFLDDFRTSPEGAPTTIKEWIDAAILFDESYKQALEYGRTWDEEHGGKKQRNFRKKEDMWESRTPN
uniref:Retrotransposon gag domain-containing protein n=1 Tax=Moniliophthora roreri TaxID=221103 RepID=A0A0W0FI72_MONRR